ncbi:MAG TPA: tetratricopeptide repeat protein [Pyrinomonadaceae bacterium]|nr:tetratricopeptide repeat protein [Pyrinomonadaceae bacterium]
MNLHSQSLGRPGTWIVRHFPLLKPWIHRLSQRYAAKALESYMQGNLQAAAADYCEAIQWQPDDATLHSDLGQVYLEDGKIDEAETEFEKALERDYKNLRALKGLGSLLQDKGDSARAMYLYLRYLETDPRDALVLHNLGAIFHNMGNYDQALEYYARAAKEDPDDLLIRKNQGLTLIAAGRQAEAKETLLQAAKLDPDDGSIDRLLATIYESEVNSDKAFEHYNSAIRKDPEDGESHLQLAFFHSGRKEFREGAKYAEKAAKLFVESGDFDGACQAYWELGWDRYLLKEFEKSLDASSESLRFDPNQGPVYFNLGLVLLHLGREAEARKRYKDGIQNLTQIADLKYYAIDDLRDALAKNPNLTGGAEILRMLEEKYAASSQEITTVAEQTTASMT